MKKTVKNLFTIIALGLVFVSCEKEDKLNSSSVLTKEDPIMNSTDMYLVSTFKDDFNMEVLYRWDRNQYGPNKDAARNLYPPKLENVKPAMQMVDKVWLKSYEEVAGKNFLKQIRPGSFILAGGRAWNDNGTITLGLASGGVQITLFETDYVGQDKAAALQFIHTIQHEYIHIINQHTEFNELVYSERNRGDYSAQWYDIPSDLNPQSPKKFKDKDGNPWTIDAYGNILGFITGYARANAFEDFAETASMLLAKTPAEINKIMDDIREYERMTPAKRATYGLSAELYKSGGAEKLEYKIKFVKDYFKKEFDINFDDLIRVANKNAAESPMLNRGGSITEEVFGYNKVGNNQKVLRYCQGHADFAQKVK